MRLLAIYTYISLFQIVSQSDIVMFVNSTTKNISFKNIK